MSMKKVYLAASFSYQDRNKGNERKKEIENIVHHIKSMTGDRYDFFIPHLLKIPTEWDMSLEQWSNEVYKHDVKALEEAEIVIFLSYGKENNAGSAWEIGYSFAKNKIIVMIKMTDEIESLMLFGSVERIIKKDEIDTYDWINLPKYKTTLHKLS